MKKLILLLLIAVPVFAQHNRQSRYYVDTQDSVVQTVLGLYGNDVIHNLAIGYGTLFYNTIGSNNIAFGRGVLNGNTSGTDNIGIGTDAIYANQVGYNNIGIGSDALRFQRANDCIAIGSQSLYQNYDGIYNIGIGTGVLTSNVSASSNIGIGQYVLHSNLANYNIGIGSEALRYNTWGYGNVAIGNLAMRDNDSAWYNTAVGYGSLTYLTTWGENTAIGAYSLSVDSVGNENTAVGFKSMELFCPQFPSNGVTGAGGYNTGVGSQALGQELTGLKNVGIGRQAGYSLTTGDYNTFLGSETGLSSGGFSGSIAIGYLAQVNTSHELSIGSATWPIYTQRYNGSLYWTYNNDTLIAWKALTAMGRLKAVGVPIVSNAARIMLDLVDTTNYGAGVGGGITFSGKYSSAGDYTTWGGVVGIKENSSNYNYAGALVFHTVPYATGLFTEGMRLSSLGNLLIGTTSDAGKKLQVSGDAAVTGTATIGTASITSNGTVGGDWSVTGNVTGANTYTVLKGTVAFSGTDARVASYQSGATSSTIWTANAVSADGTTLPLANDWFKVYAKTDSVVFIRGATSNTSGMTVSFIGIQ